MSTNLGQTSSHHEFAVDGPCVTIRRFGAAAIPIGALCPPGVDELLAWAVRAKANVIVSGGTGAGKKKKPRKKHDAAQPRRQR